jgi:hypothetical protein
MAAVALMGVGPIRRAYEEDRATLRRGAEGEGDA